MKVAVVGATGLVGGVMLKVLEERDFPVTEIIPVASAKSAGKMVIFKGKEIPVTGFDYAISAKPKLALFSAGTPTSRHYAPLFARAGCTVIDNSSAWRIENHIKLVVPEVNANVISKNDKIIANPNCSTIQLVLVLAPLHRRYCIKRVVVSTYQSVTGTGMKAVKQLMNERQGINGDKAYPYPIDMNCFPQGGTFTGNGYTTEELKLINETKKIIGDYSIGITCTVVRVPLTGGHSESVNVQFEKEYDLDELKMIISSAPGVVLQDDPDNQLYPMPLFAEGKDEVFAGRIRRDESASNAANLWIVSDNLRKGAATNAVQIAEYLLARKLV